MMLVIAASIFFAGILIGGAIEEGFKSFVKALRDIFGKPEDAEKEEE